MIGLGLRLARLRSRGLIVPGGGGGGGVNAVTFDGTNDWLTRGGAITGATDNKLLLLSYWFRLNGSDDVQVEYFVSAAGHLVMSRTGANLLQWSFQDSTGGIVWSGRSTNTFTVAGSEWVNVLMSVDALAAVRHLYVNDVLETVTSEVTADKIIDWTETDIGWGAKVNGDRKFNGDLAEVYMTNEHLDLSVEANRRKFIDAAGDPVDLGSDGSTPTGTAPLIFFSGDTDAWHTNKGSGGGFTENGALTDAADGP